MRLDERLVSLGLISTKAQARLLIIEKGVLLNGNKVTKPGKTIKESDTIVLLEKQRFVSRGGYKLEAALQKCNVSVQGKKVLDIGSSTGGFTDCLLQNGAIYVLAVDVGSNQFSQSLLRDARVTLLENTDIRNLTEPTHYFDTVVIDVSFISLTHVIPVLSKFLVTNGEVVALIKPQFEVGKNNINKQGLVKDEALYKEVFTKIENAFKEYFFDVQGIIPSPIEGGNGNKEFLMYAIKK